MHVKSKSTAVQGWEVSFKSFWGKQNEKKRDGEVKRERETEREIYVGRKITFVAQKDSGKWCVIRQ